MRFKPLIFVLITTLVNQAVAQNINCGYDETWYSDGLSNNTYYFCSLKTDISYPLHGPSRIIGQHRTNRNDQNVERLVASDGVTFQTISSIYCQKFSNLKAIGIANVRAEHVDNDAFQYCGKLKSLLLSHNRLKELPENMLIFNGELKSVYFEHNQLTTLPEYIFIYQKELELVGLSHNQIKFLPRGIFTYLSKLKSLFIAYNQLTNINPAWFANLRNLAVLNLEVNKISDLPQNAFASLVNIEGIGMNRNQLKTVHSDSFGTHNKLTLLGFKDNKVESFDQRIIDKTALTWLELQNNICANVNLNNRNDIKSSLGQCFKNYRPRSQSQQQQNVLEVKIQVKPQQYAGICGKGKTVQSTIIGGRHISRGDYPWLVALVYRNGRFFCGGTLISNRKITTAAHCVQDKTLKTAEPARNVVALLGAHDLKDNYEPGRYLGVIKSLHMHPDWNPETENYDADIAVVVLEQEITFSKYIQPICLTSSLPAVAEGIVVGFGKSEDTSKLHENIPKVLNMPIHNNTKCFLKNYVLARFSSERTFCAGSGKGVGVCKGDSGGALAVSYGGSFYLQGIVSASLYDDNHSCDVNTYSIFTDMTKFVNWVNRINVN